MLGFGATLSGASTLLIGTLKNVTGPELSVNMVESINMDDEVATYLVGIIRRGPATFEVLYDGEVAGNYSKAQAALESRTPEAWTITLSNTSTIVFTGAVSRLGGPTGGEEDDITFSMEIQPTSGDVDYTGAA